MTGAGARDLEVILAILESARSDESNPGFTRSLVDQLVGIVGCDYARYFELDTARQVEHVHIVSSAEAAAFPERVAPIEDHADWEEYFNHPCHRASVGEPSGIFRLSDLIHRKRMSSEDVALMHEAIGTSGGDRISIQIDAPGWTGFVFDRADSHFVRREDELAHVLQAHLSQLYAESVRRSQLSAALTVLEHEEDVGVILLSLGGSVEFASAVAQRMVRDHFAASTVRLPALLEDWHRNDPGRPLIVSGSRHDLSIEAISTTALILRERPTGIARLTHREEEVMRCLAAGLSNAEIGRRLWIEPATVRKHLEHIYGKLGVRSRTAALAKTRVAFDDNGSHPGSGGVRAVDGR